MAKKNKRNRRSGTGAARRREPVRPLQQPELLQNAFNAHQQGNLHFAERNYEAFLDLNPGHPEASHNLGLVKYNQGQLAQAQPPLLATFPQLLAGGQQRVLRLAGSAGGAGYRSPSPPEAEQGGAEGSSGTTQGWPASACHSW